MMKVQMFADYFVIERGGSNRSYFALFVDDDKTSWTRHIARAAKYSESDEAQEAIRCIQARELYRKGICSDCKQKHKDQIEQYPVGARVVTISEISGNGDSGTTLPFGTIGRVTGHCDDGRAFIVFDGDNGSHTFHFPEQNIAAEWKPAKKGNRK